MEELEAAKEKIEQLEETLALERHEKEVLTARLEHTQSQLRESIAQVELQTRLQLVSWLGRRPLFLCSNKATLRCLKNLKKSNLQSKAV